MLLFVLLSLGCLLCATTGISARSFDSLQTMSLLPLTLSGKRKPHHSTCLQADQDAELNKWAIENKPAFTGVWVIQAYFYGYGFSFQHWTFQHRISNGWLI